MRERLAIVFMTLNVMATLVLGGAIAYDFAHRNSATAAQPATGGVAGAAYTSPSGAATPSSGTASSGTPAPSSSAPVASSGGAAPAVHTASAGKATTHSVAPASSGGNSTG